MTLKLSVNLRWTIQWNLVDKFKILHKNHFEMLKIEIFDKVVTLWRNS